MIRPLVHAAMRGYDGAVALLRAQMPRAREYRRKRLATERYLDEFARASPARFDGTVLVDGTFMNPNYWARYALLRRALGLSAGREIGLMGPFSRDRARATFANFGFAESFDLHSHPDAACRAQAAEIARTMRAPADVLAWAAPDGVHPSIFYDGALKRQRLAAVDPLREDFPSILAEALTAYERTRAALDRYAPSLVVVSHPFNFICGGLAWQALACGIPVVLAFGLFGVQRYARFAKPEDLFDFYDQPTAADIDALPPAIAQSMRAAGHAYIAARLGGRTDDLAALYAFRRSPDRVDRRAICTHFGWDPAKPLVALYASNWFDWPHQLGMRNFRDFLDWIEVSFAAARANGAVNWLFKPHPAEDWFGGIGLAEIMRRVGAAPNVGVSSKAWNNAAVMESIDALVTYHGTAGIELAAQGKPVMLPDRGKYHGAGFAQVADSRADYVARLSGEWWRNWDAETARRRAEIYAGWWFCTTDWQGGFLFPDDPLQDALYDVQIGLFRDNPAALARELDEIGHWWLSGELHYHTHKMRRAGGHAPSNVA